MTTSQLHHRLGHDLDNAPKPADRQLLSGHVHPFATRLQSIAHVLGVPVATFFRGPSAPPEDRAGLDGAPSERETAEMHRLFQEIQNADIRRQCLGMIRALSTIDRKSSV